jgi:hypothetical protein
LISNAQTFDHHVQLPRTLAVRKYRIEASSASKEVGERARGRVGGMVQNPRVRAIQPYWKAVQNDHLLSHLGRADLSLSR